MKLILSICLALCCFVSNSQWYGYGGALSEIQPDDTDYFNTTMWQDSTVVNNFSDGYSPVWMYGIGQVLDPTSQIFEFSDDINLSEDQPYMVDSLDFPYNYLRIQNEAPDTLVIQFFKQEN